MEVWKWISEHSGLLFDGFGGAAILAIIGWIITALLSKPNKSMKQNQRGGIGSTNTQIGSVKIEQRPDE